MPLPSCILDRILDIWSLTYSNFAKEISRSVDVCFNPLIVSLISLAISVSVIKSANKPWLSVFSISWVILLFVFINASPEFLICSDAMGIVLFNSSAVWSRLVIILSIFFCFL